MSRATSLFEKLGLSRGLGGCFACVFWSLLAFQRLIPEHFDDVSLAGLFLSCQSCDEVAAGTESPAGADTDADCGTGTLGLLT